MSSPKFLLLDAPVAGVAGPLAERIFQNLRSLTSDKGIGTVILRVLEAGALSGDATPHELNQGGPSSDPSYAQNALRANALHFLKKDDSETLAQVPIRIALMNPKVSTVLVGFSELTQINEAVSCVGHEPFTHAQLEQLENLYKTDFGLG